MTGNRSEGLHTWSSARSHFISCLRTPIFFQVRNSGCLEKAESYYRVIAGSQ
ncbi:unnamed protein product [Larinioides sclopetarius]|uniref:Uncharacterized protein n=1 Tax=Larinioides sclopetarius TaxID=280406 RepID=A0AAV2A606_9ARAC